MIDFLGWNIPLLELGLHSRQTCAHAHILPSIARSSAGLERPRHHGVSSVRTRLRSSELRVIPVAATEDSGSSSETTQTPRLHEQVPAKWRNWYEGAGHRLKALIVLIATSEQELSDREFTSFARRQLRAFHSDLNPTSTTAGECCRFLTEVLASS